jgi:hypothetical protein
MSHASALVQEQQQQQPQAQQQPPRVRRVREDENTVVVRGTRYTKLECVGRGGSSKVYKVGLLIDLGARFLLHGLASDACMLASGKLLSRLLARRCYL